MSLPQATKDTSAHPGRNSVTEPTDAATMHADVDRKMRLYGAIEAFRQGKLPDNQQIDETLKYVNTHSPVDTNALSPEGKKLIQDTRDIIETARLMVAQKNADELFQNFFFHTQGTDFSRAKQDGDVVPVNKSDADKDKQDAVKHLRTLLTLFATNSEARKLLSDFGLIGRDLFTRGASKALDSARPTPEQLAHVDDAAPSDQWKTTDGKIIGPNATPTLQVKNPAGEGDVQYHPHEGATVGYNDGTRKDPAGVQADAQALAEQGLRKKEEAKAEGDAHAREVQARVEGAPDEEKGEVAKRSLREKIMGVRDRIPQEHKDRANEQVDKARDFLRDEFPEERRDQFIYRMKKVIVECQKHDDYQASIRWFLSAIESYHGHSKTVASSGQNSAKNVTSDPSLRLATRELRTLLERFANGQSMDPILDATGTLWDDAQKDEDLRAWFRKLDEYVRKVLLEPGYVLQPQCNSRGDEIREEGRRFFDHKYKAHKDNLFDSIQRWFTAMGDDPLNKRFGEDWQRLSKDLLFDSNGNLAFKPTLWSDIRRVILPAIVEQVGYIPIPRVEYTDNQLDLVIENLTLQGKNLFPNVVEIEAHNYVKFSPYRAINDEQVHDLTLSFGHIQADMRDVAFYFNKKSGMPKLKDSGLADVLLGGEGLSAKVHIKSAPAKDKSSVFYVKDVRVKIDSLKFSIRDSKHDALYKILKPLATGLIKKQIAKAIEGAIRTGLEYVDEQLVATRDRMNDAQATGEKSRTEVLKEMFERKKDEASSKTSKADSQFRIVSKRDSVLIPNAGHESGWINKQADREAAINDGQGWKSKAFTIV
ncbi:putative protein C32A11,02c [Schizosaccharomyces pombe 972h-] [Rhizoctonia solani]|uniref:Uncharacterized protein n=1 Tax=Rhizoctonia solani TaxID=456999 RepID=A0A0K6G807_9AGAM|nr:putative protein C32A11,02c [Schizosaccharomyces pombe 972h-] [Rhizoctonia solani]